MEAIGQTAAAGRSRLGEVETAGRGRRTGTPLLLSAPRGLAECGGFQLAVAPWEWSSPVGSSLPVLGWESEE